MSEHTLAIYLQLNILWNKDIRDACFTYEDRRWKDGQISLLTQMLNEVNGKKEPSAIDRFKRMLKEMKAAGL